MAKARDLEREVGVEWQQLPTPCVVRTLRTGDRGVKSGLGDGVQEVILHWKSERGVDIKLCEIENEAFQEEEAACGGQEYGIFEKSEQQTNGWT